MKHPFRHAALAAALACAFVLPAHADQNIALDAVPAPVMKAVKDRLPGAEVVSAERDTDDGRDKFEVKVRSEGKRYTVDVTPDGKLLEVDLDD